MIQSLAELRDLINSETKFLEITADEWYMTRAEMQEAIKDIWGICLVNQGIKRRHFLAFGLPIFVKGEKNGS